MSPRKLLQVSALEWNLWKQKSRIPEEIRKELRAFQFEIDPEQGFEGIVSKLNESVLTSGKRMRPLLGLLFARLFGPDHPELQACLRVAETLHAATLIHDDVIDEADRRRGKDSFNSLVGNQRAVLAGDFLIAHIVQEMAATHQVGLLHDLSLVVKKMVWAEWLQLESRWVVHRSHDHLIRICNGKTSALISWVICLGASLSQQKKSIIEDLRRVAECVGQAFQMIDDVIDFEASSGKAFAKDLKEGLVNHVSVEMLLENPSLEKDLKALFEKKAFDVFWERSELESAQRRVREAAKTQLYTAKSTLEKMNAAQCFAASEASEDALAKIYFLIDQLMEREF